MTDEQSWFGSEEFVDFPEWGVTWVVMWEGKRKTFATEEEARAEWERLLAEKRRDNDDRIT